jgi:CRP-like cAMP-binding protein
MDTTQILLGTYLFGDLTPAAAEQIARVSHRLAFAKGEAVFRAGDPATAAYVVTAGQFSESWASPDGEQYIYEVYGPCDVFGEPGIFAPNATASSTSPPWSLPKSSPSAAMRSSLPCHAITP